MGDQFEAELFRYIRKVATEKAVVGEDVEGAACLKKCESMGREICSSDGLSQLVAEASRLMGGQAQNEAEPEVCFSMCAAKLDPLIGCSPACSNSASADCMLAWLIQYTASTQYQDPINSRSIQFNKMQQLIQ